MYAVTESEDGVRYMDDVGLERAIRKADLAPASADLT